MGHKIGYARVSTTDQNPQLQLDALAAEDCLKTYTDTATGTKADRPEWNKCLADLRPGDTLIIWKIDRPPARRTPFSAEDSVPSTKALTPAPANSKTASAGHKVPRSAGHWLYSQP